MELMLVGVAVVSLVLAVVMGLVAWRLLRDGKQRSSARVELLAALAAADTTELPAHSETPDLFDSEIRQSDESQNPRFTESPNPRIPESQNPSVPAVRFSALENDDDVPEVDVLREAPMFDTVVDRPAAAGRRWLVLTATVVIMAAGAVGAVKLAAWRSTSAPSSDPAAPGVVASVPSGARGAAIDAALELLSLRHSADEPGFFTVTGLVQGPPNVRISREVVAVVYLFDQNGQYFAMGKSPIERPALDPKEQSPFVVRVPAGLSVSRYRVGFRLDSGEVVAHKDSRTTEATPVSPTADKAIVDPASPKSDRAKAEPLR